jgi:hypothetical protein
MRLERYGSLFLLFLVLLVTSCEKAEKAIRLPDKGPAQMVRVDMGEDYEDQIFFDFETGQPVMTSKVFSWDLAFENGANGYHIFINGGKNVLVYNSQMTNPDLVLNTSSVGTEDWRFDAPSALPDSTAIGEWRNTSGQSKNEVYLIKLPGDVFKKIVIESVSSTEYVLQYGDMSGPMNTITISKNDAYNYSYFSFDNGGHIPMPEPPKATWDIVFTQYRFIYYELNNFPYLVNGALLNPYNTTGKVDTLTPYENIDYNHVLNSGPFSDHRDVIGFLWKKYNFGNGRYEIMPGRTYIVKNRNAQVWKLKFLDFYSPTGLKGSPSFQFERIH